MAPAFHFGTSAVLVNSSSSPQHYMQSWTSLLDRLGSGQLVLYWYLFSVPEFRGILVPKEVLFLRVTSNSDTETPVAVSPLHKHRQMSTVSLALAVACAQQDEAL